MECLEGWVLEGIPNCDIKACKNNYHNWTEPIHNLRGCLDNIKGAAPTCGIAIIKVSMPCWTTIYLIAVFWYGGMVLQLLLYTKIFN